MSLGAPPAIAARRPGTGIACSSAVCACSASRQGPSAHAKQNIGVCCGALKCGPSPPSRPGGASRACAWCVCGASAPCCGPAGRAGRGLRTASTALCRSRRIVAQNPYTAGHSTLVSLTSAESAAAFMEGPTGGGGPRGGGGTPRRRWRARARVPGGPQLAKFVGVLQELRDAGEMLHTQTEAALCERLEPWAAVRARVQLPIPSLPQHLRLRPGGFVRSARGAGSGSSCARSPGGEPPARALAAGTPGGLSPPPAVLTPQVPTMRLTFTVMAGSTSSSMLYNKAKDGIAIKTNIRLGAGTASLLPTNFHFCRGRPPSRSQAEWEEVRAARRAADRAAAAAHEARLAHLGHRGGVANGLSAALGRRADASGPALAAAEARRAAEASAPCFCIHVVMHLTGAATGWVTRPLGPATPRPVRHRM